MSYNPLAVTPLREELRSAVESTLRELIDQEPGFEATPFARPELNTEDEARLAELIDEILGSVTGVDPIWSVEGPLDLPELRLDVDYDEDGPDGLAMRAWFSVVAGNGAAVMTTYTTRPHRYRRIRLAIELGGHTDLAGQLASFLESMIAQLNIITEADYRLISSLPGNTTGQLIFDTETETVVGAQSALIVDPVELEARIDEIDEHYGTVNEALLDGDPKAVAIATELGRPVR